jgi:hypothetical protein
VKIAGQKVKDFEEIRLAGGLPILLSGWIEIDFQQTRQRLVNQGGAVILVPQQMRLGIASGIKREEEGVVMGRRSQAVNELRQKAHDNHFGIQAATLHHVMELGVVQHNHVTGMQNQTVFPDSEGTFTLDGHEQLQALVPGGSVGEPARSKMKETDHEGKFTIQLLIIPAGWIHQVANAMRLELEPARDCQQFG